MNKEEIKLAALKMIEDNRDNLITIGRALYEMPETGFKEVRTSEYVKNVLEDCGLCVHDHLAITGMKATANGRKPSVNIAVMGELDALVMPSHSHSDPVTGAFHGCGHHAQLTTMLGVAIGLVKNGLLAELDGNLTFIGVPAEEVIEQDYRRELKKRGELFFLSGKQELIRLGVFDDVDMVLCSHIMGHISQPHSWAGHSWNGVIFKTVRYIGRSAHAGLAPENGINALEAALCGMNNINALRESFLDSDHVRVHYIITKGGDSCSVIPDDVRIEIGVRAANAAALQCAESRVDRALRLGAEAIGAEIQIETSGMDMPCHQNNALGQIYLDNARSILGEENVENVFGSHRGSSTDCGDVASLIPLLHPYFGGAVGTPHAPNFDIVDDYAAYVVPAKIAATTIVDLLFNDAELSRQIKDNYKPVFVCKQQ